MKNHDLRHSHASFMLSLGMNDLEIQNRLGMLILRPHMEHTLI